MLKTSSLALACVALLAVTTQQAQALPISPTFDVFDELTEATFNPAGPSGIPNDAVAITTFVVGTNGSSNTITLGLTATERFSEPPVGNDGAGTFSALAGGFPGDSALARWNFGYFIKIEKTGGGTPTASFADFIVRLLYDFDPAAGTDEADLGVLDFNTAIATLGGTPSAVTLVQDSQNLGFGFLAGIPPLPFITPPAFGAFDPNAIGEYTFALQVFSAGADPTSDVPLGLAAIHVNTVPEPISASLFGIGALGLAIGGARRRRRKQTA